MIIATILGYAFITFSGIITLVLTLTIINDQLDMEDYN